ncbi:MAG: hypothetical protein ACRC8S_16600 [Fimbriiglobus sp.]
MTLPPVRYFDLRLGRMSFRELTRLCQWNPIAMMIVFPSKIGLQVLSLPKVAFRERWIPVEPDRIRDEIYDRMMEQIEGLEEEGFEVTNWGKNIFLERDRRLHVALLWHPSGKMAGGVVDLIEPNETNTITGVSTRYKNGDYLITSSERQAFDLPEKFKTEHHPKAKPGFLVERHLERQAEHGSTIQPYARDEGPDRNLAFEAELLEYLVDRGILVELDDDTISDLWQSRKVD